MSNEVFIIVQGMDLKNIETQLALQCAPLITGLKIANLLNVPRENEKVVQAFLKKAGISFFRLARTEKKTTFLLYNRKQLEEFLGKKEVVEILKNEKYSGAYLGKVLLDFQKRFQAHLDGEREFPHEMGVFLGYPIEDVKGFIDYQGKNFLYSGYWKVYADAPKKIQLFQKFEQAKETLIQMLSRGIAMEAIIKLYSEKRQQCVMC